MIESCGIDTHVSAVILSCSAHDCAAGNSGGEAKAAALHDPARPLIAFPEARAISEGHRGTQ